MTGRRSFLRGALAGGAVLAGGLWLPRSLAAQDCALTETNIEGPFYLPGAPIHADLSRGVRGTPLVLTGRVSSRCRALANAELDVWQADAHGDYDLQGFGLRGRVRTDRNGCYRVDTIIPGRYLNGPQYRPAHIHVKVRVEGREALTTQLYFAGDPYNEVDPWFLPGLMLRPQSGRASFDFSV